MYSRHSGARRVNVALIQRGTDLLLSIRDDGKGIGDHVAELRPDSIGIGLTGMRERAAELGGKLRVMNADPGTVVEICIPFAVLLSK
jgi:signal transduction histidine kinase